MKNHSPLLGFELGTNTFSRSRWNTISISSHLFILERLLINCKLYLSWRFKLADKIPTWIYKEKQPISSKKWQWIINISRCIQFIAFLQAQSKTKYASIKHVLYISASAWVASTSKFKHLVKISFLHFLHIFFKILMQKWWNIRLL